MTIPFPQGESARPWNGWKVWRALDRPWLPGRLLEAHVTRISAQLEESQGLRQWRWREMEGCQAGRE